MSMTTQPPNNVFEGEARHALKVVIIDVLRDMVTEANEGRLRISGNVEEAEAVAIERLMRLGANLNPSGSL